PRRELEVQVGFWMDTLCVPVKEEWYEYRKRCIRNMRHTYQAASAVLVLDSWLQGIPYTAPVSDRCARLHQSSWIRRLWTFQEGFLAQELYYQFSDKSQYFRDLSNEACDFEKALAAHGVYTSFANRADT